MTVRNEHRRFLTLSGLFSPLPFHCQIYPLNGIISIYYNVSTKVFEVKSFLFWSKKELWMHELHLHWADHFWVGEWRLLFWFVIINRWRTGEPSNQLVKFIDSRLNDHFVISIHWWRQRDWCDPNHFFSCHSILIVQCTHRHKQCMYWYSELSKT